VKAVITKGARSHLLNVSVTERVDDRDIVTETNGVPISRVFLEAGHRTLESEQSPFMDVRISERGLSLSSARAAAIAEEPTGRFGDRVLHTSRSSARAMEPLTRFSIERSHGNRLVARETLHGMEFETERIVFKQQIGTDCVVLSNNAVIEAYRLLHDGRDVGDVALRYMRPVTNVLYRETGATIIAFLSWVVTDIH
jgi:hypothetical protein